ncbi:MAG: DUF2752 domain-containing protein [Actinomycetota bacterium]|nr:DUF2752 domain-containing protein [Actinomycetota bacterium]
MAVTTNDQSAGGPACDLHARDHGPCDHHETAPGTAGPPVMFGRTIPAWVPPVLVAAFAAVGCLVAGLVDPGGSSVLPGCPFFEMTGLDCPGCGISRGAHALARGDVATALDHNVLLAVLVPGAIVAWLAWFGRSVGLPIGRYRPSTRVAWAVVAVIAAFGVVRNLPIDALFVLDARA